MGIKVFRAIPGLLLLLIINMFVNFFLQPLVVLMPYYILNLHGGSLILLGFIQMLIPAASLVGALIPSFKKTWKNKFLVICLCLLFVNIGYLIYALAPIGFFPLLGIGKVQEVINFFKSVNLPEAETGISAGLERLKIYDNIMKTLTS